MRTVVFVDTNLFLQCRDIKSLPWRTISQDGDIIVMISRPVQAELDNLKGDGNNRRAKRARAANTIIREILSKPDMCFAIDDSQPTVSFAFPPDYSKAELATVGEWLDLTRADHELVAIASLYMRVNPNDYVYLLTNDTLPMLTARRCGLSWLQTPDEWQLPPEGDDKDKRIIELEQKLTRLERRLPRLEASSSVDIDDVGSDNSVAIRNYEKITESQMEELVSALGEQHPPQTIFPREEKDLPASERSIARLGAFNALRHYEPPTEEEIAEYRDVEYPKWLSRLRGWLEKTQDSLIEVSRYIPVSFEIANTGDAPLINCVAEFIVHNGASFCPPDMAEELDKLFNIADLPKPPALPKGRWRDTSSVFAGLSSLFPRLGMLSSVLGPHFPVLSPTPPRRDKHAFYWLGGQPSQAAPKWRFECDEFRHKVEPERFDMYLYVPVDCLQPEVTITCRVTGSNLVDPFSCYLRIKLEHKPCMIIEEITRLIAERNRPAS